MDTMLIINILMALTLFKFVLVPVHTLLSALCLRALRRHLNVKTGSPS
ncbi:hypothetical protein [Shewanella glacialipiscicola]